MASSAPKQKSVLNPDPVPITEYVLCTESVVCTGSIPCMESVLLRWTGGRAWFARLPLSWLVAGWLVAGWMLFASTPSHAGGGPENVFLLVNSTSQDSLTVANHYQSLRNIPATNVFHLPFSGSTGDAPVAQFRNKILLPALAEIQRRNLTSQIDYLVYSCDFPWRIHFKADFPDEKFAPQFRAQGSLTGLTFLQALIKAKRKEIVYPNTNMYYVEPMHGITISRAFRSEYRWAPGGKRAGGHGLSYMISSILGVTGDRGNKVFEIVNSLQLAQQADGTKPKGTVYFMKHNGPRSTPRHGLFAAAATELRSLDVDAQILNGKFPSYKTNIVGLTCGTSHENVGKSGCRFVPGAICDNLTSTGADLSVPKSLINPDTGKKRRFQVSVADFIRHGATAACGTVVEPYNIRQKFPLPSMHVHYAHGCSLGEAFYQSVSGPYQQLLVGDPLCQPWADIPHVQVAELTKGKILRGEVEMTPEVAQQQQAIREFELYVDGVLSQSCKPGEKLLLDSTTLKDGYHEFRVVARDDTPIETQGRLIADVVIKNGRDAISITTKDKRFSKNSEYVSVSVTATRETHVDVYCGNRVVGSVPAGSGTVRIRTKEVGAGPVRFHAESSELRSKTLQIDIAS